MCLQIVQTLLRHTVAVVLVEHDSVEYTARASNKRQILV